MYQLVKKALFQMSPERAHHFTTNNFTRLMKVPGFAPIFDSLYGESNQGLEKELFGLKFQNPIGLAAGFDKDGKYMNAMQAMGFGFLELGTVTPKPQIGNPKPRLFRLTADDALINRMGFNNEGVDALVNRLKKFDRKQLILGSNIGKNKVTPNEDAVKDYQVCFKKLHDHVDYFVVNVSSPNTPGLRALQEKDALLEILNTLSEENEKFAIQRPILLKIAPDLNEYQLDDVISTVLESKIPGIIASNTTISRADLRTSDERIAEIGNGGLSGLPVQKRSTEIIRKIKSAAGDRIKIVGVGGINSAKAAKEKIDAGAELVQIYTGLIYEGPALIRDIKRGLKTYN